MRTPPTRASQDGAARRVETARVPPRILRRCVPLRIPASTRPSAVRSSPRERSRRSVIISGSLGGTTRRNFRTVTIALLRGPGPSPLSLRRNLQCRVPRKCIRVNADCGFVRSRVHLPRKNSCDVTLINSALFIPFSIFHPPSLSICLSRESRHSGIHGIALQVCCRKFICAFCMTLDRLLRNHDSIMRYCACKYSPLFLFFFLRSSLFSFSFSPPS